MYRPRNKEELFNLRHASARNIIERIFGVLKRRFRILLLAPEYNMNIQAQIPTALCAIHNFIRMHDPEETDEMLLETQPSIDSEDSDSQFPVMDMMRENTEASMRRDQIAQEMWEDYLQVLYDRGISDIVDPLDDDDFDDLYDNE
jgi:hypothetical protein